MTGLVRNAALTVACLMVASVALAGVPSATTSLIGSGVRPRINTGAYSNSASDPANAADSVSQGTKLQVLVKDLAGNVVAGSNVVIDFSGCAGAGGDIKIGSAQSYHAETVGCSGVTVSDYTNASGIVNFVVIAGNTRGTAHAYGCAKVYADGVLLGSIGVGTFDMSASGGITAGDIAYFWNDYFSGLNQDRADISGDGSVSAADVAYAWNVYFAIPVRENASPATYCP